MDKREEYLRRKGEQEEQESISYAEEFLDDNQYDWIRPLSRRRTMVVITAVLYVAVVFSPVKWLSISLFIGFLACALLLRIATRTITDVFFPDKLDERLKLLRGEVYKKSFNVLYVVLLGWFLLFLGSDAINLPWDIGWDTFESPSDFIIFLSFGVGAIPDSVLAWTEEFI